MTSRRLSVRCQYSVTSRTSQSLACSARTASTARTAAGSPCVAERPRAELQRVGPQVQDRVVQRAAQRERPPRSAGRGDAGRVGRLRIGRRVQREGGDPLLAVERDLEVRVGDAVIADRAVQRRQRDPRRAGRAIRRRGALLRDCTGAGQQLAGGDDLVDEAPCDRAAALDPLGDRAQHVGVVAAHPALVDQTGEATGARQHAEQGNLGQRDGGAAVVDEQQHVARQGELVAAARTGAVDRCDPRLARVRRRVLDAVARLVGELAEVHLPGMAGRRQHLDVGAGAEHAVLAAGDDHRPDLGVLEPQPLHGVGELDVHAEVVAVELERVALHQPAGLVDVEHQRRERRLDLQAPVPVGRGVGLEGDVHPRDLRLTGQSSQSPVSCPSGVGRLRMAR